MLREFTVLRNFACLVICVFGSVVTVGSAVAQDLHLAATPEMKWYRGNMHTHSLWSDGDDYPEMIADWYREKGYSFLVFTDHNVLLNRERWIDAEKNAGGLKALEKLRQRFPDWIETRIEKEREQVRLRQFDEVFDKFAVPGEYLLIQGEEITDRFKNLPIHLCATNTNELLPPLHGDSVYDVMQRNIDAAYSRRERTGVKTLVHLNHPNFHYAVTAEELMKVSGENFFEVYNGHPTVHNSGDDHNASTERMWDIINSMRLSELELPLMYGLATDDGHKYHVTEPGRGSQPGRGWVMVLASKLTPDAIVEALEAGQFYSSSGVTLSAVRVADDTFTVDVEADEDCEYRIQFIGTRKGFDSSSSPAVEDAEKAAKMTKVYSEEVGEVLQTTDGTTASYEFQGDELYVRAVVTSSRRHPNPSEAGDFEQAWVQPVRP